MACQSLFSVQNKIFGDNSHNMRESVFWENKMLWHLFT